MVIVKSKGQEYFTKGPLRTTGYVKQARKQPKNIALTNIG
jgi:hypothetical protein